MGQSFETQRLSQDGGDCFGSGLLADATVSGAVSMAPNSGVGVMSARACRVLARVCMLVEVFGVSMIDVSNCIEVHRVGMTLNACERCLVKGEKGRVAERET